MGFKSDDGGPGGGSSLPANPGAASWMDYSDAISSHYQAIAAALDAGSQKADGWIARIIEDGDLPTIGLFKQLAPFMQTRSRPGAWFGGIYRTIIQRLDGMVSNLNLGPGLVTVDALATYYNTTPYTLLFAPEFAEVYYRAQNAQISPANVYCPGGECGPSEVPPSSNTSGVSNPGSAPTCTAKTTGGSLATGNWKVGFTYVTELGESQISPLATVAVTGPTGSIDVDPIAFPTGVVAVKFYLSEIVASTTVRLLSASRALFASTTELITLTDVPTSQYAYRTAKGIVAVEKRGWPLADCSFSGAGALTTVLMNAGAIPAANNAGVTPIVQGFSPANIELIVTEAFVGSGNVNLQITGLNQAGVSKTFTAAVIAGGVGQGVGAVVPFTPQTGGDRFRSITSISATGGGSPTDGTARIRVTAERVVR